MPTIYKTITYPETHSRTTRALTPTEESTVQTVLASFKSYFVSKHQ